MAPKVVEVGESGYREMVQFERPRPDYGVDDFVGECTNRFEHIIGRLAQRVLAQTSGHEWVVWMCRG